MYENVTYELILKRMLERVLSRYPNVDTREGSIIYTALAPFAVEMQNLYIQLDTILNETFADTASRDRLIKRAAERGITPYAATHAVLRGVFNIDVPIGSRFSLDELNYIVTERITPGVFKLECEVPGRVGNENFGNMIPIDYIKGLTSAELTELLIPGEDDEVTERFRQRYFESLHAEAYGGNVKDYQEKVGALPGVGGVKVYPVWNGGGTVRLAVIASDYSAPTPELIEAVQTAVDPEQNQGQGLGIAPIGHVVTVEGVTQTTVHIQTNITYQGDWNWADVQPYVEQAVDAYFLELAEHWDDSDALVIRISYIETRLLNLPGIEDIGDTLLNGQAQNLTLDKDAIPVRGVLHG